LIPFASNSVFKKLKHIKIFISRFIIFQEYSNRSSEFIIMAIIRVQEGIHTIDLPIGKAQAAKEWIDKLDINILSMHIYKTNLEAFID
jgi:hypothetical protein